MSACGQKFTGSIMAPLEYPSVGWEPVTLSDVCTREKGHDGDHSGTLLVLNEPDAALSPPETGGQT